MATAQNPSTFYTPPPANLVVDPPIHPQPGPSYTPPPGTDSLLAQSLATDLPTPPPPPTASFGSTHKETGPIQELPPLVSESAPLVEISETEPIPEEVEGWLQKLDQAGDIKLDKPLTHDGDILLADTEAQVVKEKLVLPLSQSGVNTGLKNKVSDSARWLAEWCVRLLKMMKDKVKYAPEPISQGPNQPI